MYYESRLLGVSMDILMREQLRRFRYSRNGSRKPAELSNPFRASAASLSTVLKYNPVSAMLLALIPLGLLVVAYRWFVYFLVLEYPLTSNNPSPSF